MPLVIDATGVAIQTGDEIAEERANAIRVATGISTLQFTGDTILGQINSAESDREASIQEQLIGAVQASNPLTAGGAQLDGLVPIGGVLAKDATHSTIAVVTLAGTSATVVPVGVLLGIPSLSPRFATDETVTLAVATAWAVATPYVAGDVRRANGMVWVCTLAGTSAAAGAGPTGGTVGFTFNDNAVLWRWVSAGDGFAQVSVHASDTGPVSCSALALTLIVTPIAGLAGCCNSDAAEPGTYAETDAALRLRYAGSFHQPGNGTVDAVFSHLDALAGVSDLVVYQNRALAPDGTKGNMPGKSIWAIVDGTETDASIAETLYDSVAGGIQIGWAGAPGTLKSYAWENSQGTIETLYWSEPEANNVAIVVTMPATVTGMTTLLTAADGPIYSYFASRRIGADAQWWQLVRAIGDALLAVGVDPDTLIVTLNGVQANVAAVYYKKLVCTGITVVPA